MRDHDFIRDEISINFDYRPADRGHRADCFLWQNLPSTRAIFQQEDNTLTRG